MTPRADAAVSHFEPNVDCRDAILLAAIGGGLLVTALTELLSALDRLTFGSLFVAWGAILVAVGLLLARRPHIRAALSLRGLPVGRPGLDLAMEAWIAILVALTGMLALFAVPTTVDSMTYHLARVAHWAQNHTVAFYPTQTMRQLYQSPWAEYAALHLFILAGGDRLANLVQWGSMVGSLVGVSLIARQLGAGVRGQILSAFLCTTIPMGILQSSTTQNDYVAALWLVCLVHALLSLESRSGPVPVLSAGASLGLALLTKGTSYVFAAPFCLVFLLVGRNRSVPRRLGQGLVIVLCALALNGPQYLRNLELFGSPLGPGGEGGYRYMNQEVSLPIFASNLLRNLGLHLGTPWPVANALVERTIEAAHSVIGISPDDPRSTWPTTRFEVIPPFAHEDLAGNGLHLLLVAVAMVAAWRSRFEGRLRSYVGCLVVAFLLFCFLLRWQPWHSRLHLPLFVFGAPVVGVAFERLNAKVVAIVLLMLTPVSVYFLTMNQAQPLTGSESVFQTTRAEQRVAAAGPAYVEAAGFVEFSGCLQVGMALRDNDPEYMLWALLADVRWRGRLEAVLVDNVSARLADGRHPPFRPCAIVRVATGPSGAGLSLGEQHYRAAWSQGGVEVLVPAPPPPTELGVGPSRLLRTVVSLAEAGVFP